MNFNGSNVYELVSHLRPRFGSPVRIHRREEEMMHNAQAALHQDVGPKDLTKKINEENGILYIFWRLPLHKQVVTNTTRKYIAQNKE